MGFTGAVIKSAKALKADKILAVFDNDTGSERTVLDAAYKANRPDFTGAADMDNPFTQLPFIFKALDTLGVPHFETPAGLETDDILAGYGKYCANSMEIIILSWDGDFFQLVGGNVYVYRYRGEHSVLWDTRAVYDRFGVSPCQMADFKALAGDASDNIAGLPGIGPKTTAKLLQAYGDIPGVLLALPGIKPARIQNTLMENTERLLRNRTLITLSGTTKPPLPPDDIPFLPDISPIKTTDILRAIGLMG